MDVLEAIINRRSIRKYNKKDIPKKIVMQLMEAAMYAPSARNTQSWQFVIINERELLDELSVIHPYAKMLNQAPLAILVCGDKTLEENDAYLSINCSASTQNILLAAHSFGLGSVWLGVYPREERMKPIAELFKLPLHIMPVSLIALGWPEEVIPKPERFHQERIHYNNTW